MLSAVRIRLVVLTLVHAAVMGIVLHAGAVAANTAKEVLAPGISVPDNSIPMTRFANVFADHMVLQRQQPIRIWGQATANAALTVTLGDLSKTTKADAAGKWQLDLPALTEGGPFSLSLSDDNGVVQTIHDVLIGDVWLCSGQSNMAMAAGEVNQSGAQAPRSPGTIRLMTIVRDSQVQAQSDYDAAPGWQLAEPATIHDFSAVCYLLAYELQKTHDVPFGLINASWGGSGIKPWISARELKLTGMYDQDLAWLETYATDEASASRRFGETWEKWWGQLDQVADQPWKEPPHTTSGWTANPERMGDWKKYGDPALANHHGMVWFRKSFDLNAAQAGQVSTLALGGIDEVDYLWINGHFIGTTFGYGTERFYRVPEGILRTGANTVTVNVLNTWASGGMVGPNNHVELKFADGIAMPIGNGWFYRKVPAEVPGPPRAPWEPLGGLAGLFNAMIAPLQGLNLKGAIWYQGETDAGNPAPYEQLLNALSSDWRKRFGESLPFLIVQLPNFGTLASTPVESGWAAIRDSQRRAAVAHPLTGLVVTIDTSDITELHPPDKRVIGRRAADVARVLAYGQPGRADGISPTAVFRQGGEIVVDFDPLDDTLVAINAAVPIALELCGDAQSDCRYADARIEANRVFLKSAGSEHATRVRHCWADAALCNLYGASGLPVSSFELKIPDK